MTLDTPTIWMAIGFVGQTAFAGRFLVQWIHAEKHRKSIIPITFWYLSLVGTIILLAYAIHRKDPVFILGQASGIIVYVRNLYFIRLEKQNTAQQSQI